MKLSTTDRKKFSVRKKLKKVSKSGRFRLSIFRSTKNISAQIIDDINNVTLLSVSSVEKDIKAMNKKNKIELSKIVAEKPNLLPPLTTFVILFMCTSFSKISSFLFSII